MKNWVIPTNSARRTMYCAAAPTSTTIKNSAACTMFRERTTPTAPAPIAIARTQKATFCAVMRASCSLLLALGADFERLRLGDRLHPLAELLLVVEEVGDVGLGVLVLGTPEQGVERTDLDADPAVHAERVVDVEAVEEADRPLAAALAPRRPLLLVSFDVDAPVGALPRTQHADGAVLFLQRDDTPRTRGWVLPLMRVLHGDGALEHRLERDAETSYEPRSLGFLRELGHLERHLQSTGDEDVREADRDQELPRHGLELILAQARVREPNPEHQERHEHDLGEQDDRPEHVRPSRVGDVRDRPAAEEQRGGEPGEREGGAELADEEEQEPEAGVLDHVAGHQLALGHRHVERRLGALGLGGDEAEHEADDLGEDKRVADTVPPEDRAVLLRLDDALEAHRARHHDDADDREQQR